MRTKKFSDTNLSRGSVDFNGMGNDLRCSGVTRPPSGSQNWFKICIWIWVDFEECPQTTHFGECLNGGSLRTPSNKIFGEWLSEGPKRVPSKSISVVFEWKRAPKSLVTKLLLRRRGLLEIWIIFGDFWSRLELNLGWRVNVSGI